MSDSVKMAFGKDASGKVISVSEVPSGLDCGCLCIECGGKLVAKKGDVLEWHFAHAATTSCGGYTPESLLHYRAKHLVAEAIERDGLHSILPDYVFAVSDYGSYDDDYDRVYIVGPGPIHGMNINIISFYGVNIMRELIPDKNCIVKIEGGSPCGRYGPDVAVHPIDQQNDDVERFVRSAFVGIEIEVTHGMDEEKLSKIKDANDISVCVDLSSLARDATDKDILLYIKDNTHLHSYGDGYLSGYKKHSKENVEFMVQKWAGIGGCVTVLDHGFFPDKWIAEIDWA